MSRPVVFFAVLWLGVALSIAAGDAIHVLAGGRGISRTDFFFRGSAYALWVPLVPVIVRIARRFAPSRGRRLRTLIVHSMACLVLSFGGLVVHKLIFCSLMTGHYLMCVTYYRLEPWLVRWLMIHCFVYAATASGIWLVDALDAIRSRDLLLSRKERELAAAELQIVHGQIPPDYLTSLFDAISARLHSDRGEAEQMITKVADFLRSSLSAIGAQELTLADDLALLEAWADVESARRGVPVVTVVEVDARVRGAAITAPMIQPLVASLVPVGSALIRVSSSVREGGAVAMRVDCSNGLAQTILLPAGSVA